jgi:hypothetical protein
LEIRERLGLGVADDGGGDESLRDGRVDFML